MGVFTTCLISIVNTKNNTITVCNAGHYNPIMIQNNGNILKETNCKKGIPIGIMKDADYTDNVFYTNEYSMVCMYTDGVLEIKDKDSDIVVISFNPEAIDLVSANMTFEHIKGQFPYHNFIGKIANTYDLSVENIDYLINELQALKEKKQNEDIH
jgi:hypothetical protein